MYVVVVVCFVLLFVWCSWLCLFAYVACVSACLICVFVSPSFEFVCLMLSLCVIVVLCLTVCVVLLCVGDVAFVSVVLDVVVFEYVCLLAVRVFCPL